MTRTLSERPGPPSSVGNDPPPEPAGFLSAYPGHRSTALPDNREHVIGACAKLADALVRGCATAGHPSSSPADLPGDPGSTPRRRPAEPYRTEQLPPARRVRVRGSQTEVDHVQP
jgi:hypothetical protein